LLSQGSRILALANGTQAHRSLFLSAALRSDVAQCEQLLQEVPDLGTCRDHRGDTLLHKLASLHFTSDAALQQVLSLLVGKGASARKCLEAQNAMGQSPLLVAANRGKGAMVAKLLQMGADVNTRDAQGQSALHLVAMRGDVETLQALLRSGAERSFRNRFGRSACEEAIRTGHQECFMQIWSADFEKCGRMRLMSVWRTHLFQK